MLLNGGFCDKEELFGVFLEKAIASFIKFNFH